MECMTFKEMVGRVVEGVFLVKADSQLGRFVYNEFYLKLDGGLCIFLSLLDPDEADCFETRELPDSAMPFRDAAGAVGAKIKDVIKSDLLSNVGLVLDNGHLLVNEIGEYQNYVEVTPMPRSIAEGDFVSLAMS
jgi:hypothetical protein